MRKMLIGLSQKARGQVQGLVILLAQMLHHRRRAATFPTLGTSAQRGKLVVLLAAHAKAVGKATSQEKPMGQRVKDEGESEGRPVMGRIGVALPFGSRWPREVVQRAERWQHHPTRKRADFPRVLTDVNSQPTDEGSNADLSARSQRPLLVQLPPPKSSR